MGNCDDLMLFDCFRNAFVTGILGLIAFLKRLHLGGCLINCFLNCISTMFVCKVQQKPLT